jgi:hypothetical protein
MCTESGDSEWKLHISTAPWLSSPSAVIKTDWGGAIPAQLRPPSSARDISDGDGDRLLLPDQHDQLLTPSDAGVEKVPLQHRVVLRHDRNDHGWIFRTLAFVDRRGIGGHQHVQFSKPVGDGSALKVGDELAIGGIDRIDVTNVAVVDLVARGQGSTEPLDLVVASGVECSL